MIKQMKQFGTVLLVTLSIGITAFWHPGSAVAYTNSRPMDDQVFDNVGSMNQGQIQNFLSASDGRLSSPSPCLNTYTNVNFHYDGTDWNYGDNTYVGNSTGWNMQSRAWNTAWGP